MRLDSTPKMEIQIGVSYTRYFMRSVCCACCFHSFLAKSCICVTL